MDLLLDSKITPNHNQRKKVQNPRLKKKKSLLDSDIIWSVQHAGLNIVLAFEC